MNLRGVVTIYNIPKNQFKSVYCDLKFPKKLKIIVEHWFMPLRVALKLSDTVLPARMF